MDFKPILELLGCEHVPGEEMTSGFLHDAVANFSANPASAISMIRRLQASNPSGFALTVVRLLVSSEEQSPGVQYVLGLVLADGVLIDLLLDERVLTLEKAVPLARNVATVEPLLDVRLVRKAVANAGGDVGATKSGAALHVLGLVDAISDCSRLAAYLVQFLRHPSAKVRSKAALLLGRANWNLGRIKGLLAISDGRVRANAVESLRKHGEQDVRKILWEATKDPCRRVVVNALLGLCQAGDREAYLQLARLADAADSVLRSGAAWAMGECGNPEFRESLEKLGRDGDAKVRAMAEKSRKKLRMAGPAVSPQVAQMPAAVAPQFRKGS